MDNVANFVADIQARINDFMSGVRKVQAAAKGLPDEVNIDVDADTGAATAQISRFKAMLRSIPNKIRVRTDVDSSPMDKIKRAYNELRDANDRFDNQMQSIASRVRAFGTVMGNQIQGSLIASFSALIPIIAALVPAIMAVGNALAVVGGGAIGLAGAFGIMYAGAGLFMGLATTALKMLEDGTIAASNATQNYQSALEGLKSTWTGLVQQNADGIFNTMANGLKFATAAVQGLTPFIEGVVNGLQAASAQMVKWVNTSSTAQNFFKMMGTTGVSVFYDLINALGRFGDGFVNLFTQFAPLFKFMSQGMQNMAIDFQAWANKVSTAEGIKNFINYTKTNLPVIGKIFGDTFMGIFNLFKAFGSNSQTIFGALSELTGRFRAWSETVGQSQGFKQFIDYVQTQGPVIMSLIGGIVNALVAFGVAMAPLGAAVLGAVTNLINFVANLMQVHPVIGMVVGVIVTLIGAFMNLYPTIMFLVDTIPVLSAAWSALSGVFALITGPIGLAIAAIVAIGAALVALYQKHEGFRTAVQNAWTAIVTAVSTAGMAIVNFLMSTFGGLVTWFQANQQGIVNIIQTAWMMISAAINASLAYIVPVLTTAWNVIVTAIQVAWELIKGIITAALAIVTGIIQAFIQVLNGDFVSAWNTLVVMIQTVWTAITTAIMNAINIIVTAISSWISNMISIISSAMSTIGSAISSAWNAITSTISSAISAIVSYVSSGFNNMLSVASSIMNSILSAITSAWSAITSAISSAISTAVSVISSGFSNMMSAVANFVSNLVSSITSGMSQFVSAVTSGASQALSAIVSGVQQMIAAVANGAGQMASAGADFVMGFVNGVRSMIGNAVSAVTDMASQAVSAAKSFLRIGSPSKLMKQIGAWMTQGFALGIEKDIPKVRTAVDRMLQPVKDGIAKLTSKNYSNAQAGASSIYSLMVKNMEDATKEIDKIARERKSISEKISKINQDLRNKMTPKARLAKQSELNKLKKQYKELGKLSLVQYKKRKTNKDLVYEIRPMQIYATRIAKKREQIAQKLDAAREKLQDAIDTRLDFRNMIRDDLRGYASIMNTGRKTSQGMVKMMTKRLNDMKQYMATIGSLKKMGLNKTTLQEILDAGIEQGGAIAKGLFAGGKDAVAQVNKLQSQINKVSTDMGNKNADYFYKAGVDAAKGVVKGLESQDKALKTIADKLAKAITDTIKKRLKIKSPSRVMMEIAGYVGSGLVNGLNTAQKKVATASSQLATAIEKNVQPKVALDPFNVDGGVQQMKRSVVSSFETNADGAVDSIKQSINIVIKSEADIGAIKHEIERLDARDATVNIIKAGGY